MSKAALVVFADTETHADLGRAFNALETAKEMKEHGDDVKIIFDGAGTKWIPEFEDEDHDAHPLYEAVKDKIHGACRFCAKEFGAFEDIQQTEVTLLDEYEQHPSIRQFVEDGYQVITF